MCENVYKDEINIVDSYSFSIMVFFTSKEIILMKFHRALLSVFIYLFSSDSLTLHKLLSCQSHIQTNTQIDKQLFMFFITLYITLPYLLWFSY